MNDAFPGRNQHKGLNQLKFDLKHIFFGEMIGYDADLSRLLQEFPADVVVMDSAFTGMLPMKLKGKAPKTAVYGILPLTMSSRDTAPFGFGMQPSSGAIGRLRNKAMNKFVQNVVFSDVQKHVNGLLDSLGAPKLHTISWMRLSYLTICFFKALVHPLNIRGAICRKALLLSDHICRQNH